MNLIEYPDRDLLMMDLADTLAGDLKNALLTHERASFCVPGGTTPGPIFDVLSAVNLDWSRITVFLNDERWVPLDHDRSNTKLLRERLLVGKAADANYAPLFAEGGPPEAHLEKLGAGLAPHFPISVLLLGMGADMHTASLFPGADKLREALDPNAPPLMAMRAEAAPEPRITLTAPILRAALTTHIVITGAEKRAAIEKARKLDPSEAPVRAVLDTAIIHWAE